MCIYIYNIDSHPPIDGKVYPYKFHGDLLFHLFGEDYVYIYIERDYVISVVKGMGMVNIFRKAMKQVGFETMYIYIYIHIHRYILFILI